MIYTDITEKIFENFIATPKNYAYQTESGMYQTYYAHLTHQKLEHSLQNKGSILTYQEAKGYVKWICLDFDITKAAIESGDNCFPELLEAVRNTSKYLTEKGVNYTLEFSGNRGFHFWIIFDEPITKAIGYGIVKTIYNEITPSSDKIDVDLYPKTSNTNPKSKRIGLGVKLPLSYHKKSGKYSYLIDNIDIFNVDKSTWPSEFDTEFLSKQYNLLLLIKKENEKSILQKLDLSESILLSSERGSKDYISQSLEIHQNNELSLDDILKKLKECQCIKKVINNYQFSLNERERTIIVGLLARLKSSNNNNFGIDLLNEFFSRFEGYESEVTQNKIKLLSNLYPPTCAKVSKEIGYDCSECTCNCEESPIELLRDIGVEHSTRSIFKLTDSLISNVAKAQIKYSYINDEVPIYSTIVDLEAFASLSEIEVHRIYRQYAYILSNMYIPDHTITKKFIRYESEIKERTLYALSANEKMLSTIAMFHLYTIWYDCLSVSSYGYRIQDSFQGGHIFKNWLIQWQYFTSELSGIINDEDRAYDSYYISKIDIKSFYDSIDIKRLSIKLFDQPIEIIQNRIDSFEPKNKERYSNIIQYLLRIYDKSKGVPQGPAYARFLAELYLVGLDEKINSYLKTGYEFYFRYVDDIFIFTCSEERSSEITAIVDEWLESNGLEKNNKKSINVNVQEFREAKKFDDYKNQTKYFIDQVDKNAGVASKKEVAKAIEQAKELLESSSFGLTDDFRFVFSHFSEDKSLNIEKKRIGERIVENKYGRGDLYKKFFDDFYFKHYDELLNEQQISRMNTLALENYLNSLLRNDREITIDYYVLLYKNLQSKSQVVKLSIIQIALKYEFQISRFIYEIDYPILHMLLKSSVQFNINKSWFDINIDHILTEIQFIDLVDDLTDYYSNNLLSIDILRDLASYFWKRANEYFDNGNEDFFRNNLHEKGNQSLFYNLLSIFFIASDFENDSSVKPIIMKLWRILLSEVRNKYEVINYKHWFEVVINYSSALIDIPESILIIGLTLNKDDGWLSTEYDCEGLIQKFRDYLLIIYSRDDIKIIGTEDGNIKLKSILNELKKEDRFLDFLDDNSTKIYPDSDSGIKNITVNNLVVLKKFNELMIKSLSSNLKDYEYVISDKLTANTVVFNLCNKYKSIDSLLEGTKNLERLNILISIYNSCIDYKNNEETKYPNIFYSNVNIAASNHYPLIPYYSDCDKIVSDDNDVVENDLSGFNELFIRLIARQDIVLCDIWESEAVVQLSNGNDSFYLDIIKDNSNDCIQLLLDFNSILSANKNKYKLFRSIHIAQWRTYYRFFQEKYPNDVNFYSRVLKVYFNYYKEDDFIKQLIFKSKEDVKKSNLKELFNTLVSSVCILEMEEEINELRESIKEVIKGITLSSEVSFDSFEEQKFKIIIKNELFRDTKYSFAGKNLFNGLNELFVLDVDRTLSFEQVKLSNVEKYIASNDRTSYMNCSGSKIYVIMLPRSLTKIVEIIELRYSALHDEGVMRNIDHRLLWDHEENINHVAEMIYKVAVHLSDHYGGKDIKKYEYRIINWLLLFNQYSLTSSKTNDYMKKKGYSVSYLYQTLLYLVLAHHITSQDDIDWFVDKFREYVNDESAIVFPLKGLTDLNGLHNILSSKNEIRNPSIVNCVDNIIDKTDEQDTLVIISDIFLTGGQTIKTIHNYSTGKAVKDGHVFDKDMQKHFIENLKSFTNIKLLSPIATDLFRDEKSDMLKNILPNVNNINVESNSFINEFNFKGLEFNANRRMLFGVLRNDQELLNSLFNISKKDWENIGDPENLNNRNVVLRLQSTPKKRIVLFTAEPKVKGVKSLFDRRKELKE